MATYILTCEHKAEECEALDKELAELGPADVIRGNDFYCSCPHEFHGGWVVVEGESADQILAQLPPVFRSHARTFEVETVRF